MSINFVSSNTISAKKQKRKEHFNKKLEDAREGFESAKKRRDLEEARGDSTWMLPSLENRITTDASKHKKSKKKHKKKSKNHKKAKDSSDNESEDEWEEAGSKSSQASSPKKEKVVVEVKQTKFIITQDNSTQPITTQEKSLENNAAKRDDWMMSTSLLDMATQASSSRENKTKKRKEEERKQAESERISVQASRELNPYWKDGGEGLPSEQIKSQAQPTRNTNVGDGGRSWVRKAYERSKQQAIAEGVPLEEVVVRRWGSMAKLEALLKSEEKPRSSTSSQSGWRKRESSPIDRNNEKRNRESSSRSEKRNENDTTRKSSPTRSERRRPESPGRHEERRESKHTLIENSNQKETKNENETNKSSGRDEVVGEKIIEKKDESSDSESSEEEETFEAYSEKERNEISAKILRAELMGNEDLCAELKKRLERGKPVTKSVHKQQQEKGKAAEEHDVILTRTDKHGNQYPVKLQESVEQMNSKKKRQKKKMDSSIYDSEGNRIKYFEDDDQTNLKSMVEKEKLTSADDQHAMMHRLASKHLGKTMGDDYTLDDMFVAASATKGTTKSEDRRVKDKAVAEHRLREKQLDSCRFCFENPKMAKHLIISIGIKTYLALPINASLTEGHCLILPMNHVVGQTYMDEDVSQEVKVFKKELVRMFADQGEDVMFMETCKNLKRQHHCVIECVPVPKAIGDMAPIYFKKAITECESEWNVNKKLVTITSTGGVSKAVPKGLPYFAVEFGLDGGYGHVIENDEEFPFNFGKEIVGGMMDLEDRLWRKPPKEGFEKHKRKVLQFSEMWKSYDWTKKLKA